MGTDIISPRLHYIDRLKGISMLMVVVGHLLIFCTIGYDNDFVRHIVLINMPLFFFLNGFVIKHIQNRQEYLITKTRQILIPFFVWGILIALFRNATFIAFLQDYWKFGYWYLLALFEFYIVYFICEIILIRFNKKLWIMILLYIVSYVLFVFINRFMPYHLNSIVDYYQFIDYYPYFFLGIIVKQTPVIDYIKKYLPIFFTATTIVATTLYLAWVNQLVPVITTILLRVSLIMGVFMIFMALDSRHNENKSTKFVNDMLATIGRHTLSIYMIQFFLFRYLNLHEIGLSVYNEGNYLILLTIVSILSILLCYLCIMIEKIIMISPLFSTVLFGKKLSRSRNAIH